MYTIQQRIETAINSLIAKELPVTANNIETESLFHTGGTIDANAPEVTEALNATPQAWGSLKGAAFNPQIIADMRTWVADCTWADMEQGEEEEKSHEDILKCVQKHYDGGIDQFVRDCQ